MIFMPLTHIGQVQLSGVPMVDADPWVWFTCGDHALALIPCPCPAIYQLPGSRTPGQWRWHNTFSPCVPPITAPGGPGPFPSRLLEVAVLLLSESFWDWCSAMPADSDWCCLLPPVNVLALKSPCLCCLLRDRYSLYKWAHSSFSVYELSPPLPSEGGVWKSGVAVKCAKKTRIRNAAITLRISEEDMVTKCALWSENSKQWI